MLVIVTMIPPSGTGRLPAPTLGRRAGGDVSPEMGGLGVTTHTHTHFLPEGSRQHCEILFGGGSP